MGALELKGLDEPVETFRARWEPRAAADQPPVPSRLATASSDEFVGRAEEHERLTVAWKAVTGGERRVVLVAGEPGIGKTTLAGRLAADAHRQGGVVLYGRCDEDLGVPYQPWVESLGQLVAHLPDEVLAAHVAERGAHLVRLVPELGRRTGAASPTDRDGDAERFVLFGCIADLLERAARVRPVLLVLDDLHWADRPTTQLFRHLVAELLTTPIGFLATYRDSDVSSGDAVVELLAQLHREPGVDRLTLGGLSDTDLLDLMERVGGHELDDDGVALRDAVLAETAGNPFFVGEVLRHLAESGALFRDETGRWVTGVDLLSAGLPVSVREVVGHRVARLGAESERLLTLASVIGRDFEVALLASVTGTDEDTVIDACDAAVAAAVLRATEDPERYTFTHALIEHTLYDSLSAARRARAHRAVAEAIETAVGTDTRRRAGELARHWARTTDADRAAGYAQLAGELALAQSAPDEALRWYQQARELVPGTDDEGSRRRIEMGIGLGRAQRQTGMASYRETLLDAARLADERDHVDLLVSAVIANSRGFFSGAGHVDEERLELIERALDRLGSVETPERAQLLALATAERTYLSPLDERVQLAERAVEVARSSGDPATLAAVLHLCMLPVMHPSTLGLRVAWLDEACDVAERLGDPVLAFWAHEWSMVAALERADGDALDAHAARAAECADRVPDATIRWNSTFYRAWLAGVRGDLARYEALAEDALHQGFESGQPDASTMYGAQLMSTRYFQGRLHEVIPLIEQAAAESPGIATYRAALAVAHAGAGDLDDVRAMIGEATERELRESDEPMTWSLTMACWADAAARSRANEIAPTLRELLAPYHDQIVTNGNSFLPSVAHHLGLLEHALGELDAADEWFAEALILHRRLRSPVLVAQTRAAWATLLADRCGDGDRAHAVELAQAAHAAAVEGGYGRVAAEARAVLDRLA